MIVAVQMIILVILASTLLAIYAGELRSTRQNAPHAMVEEAWLGPERRKHKRVRVELDATYSFPAGSQKKGSAVMRTEDISLGGIKASLGEKSKRGVPILIELKLPDTARPLVIDSEVAWVADTPEMSPDGKRSYHTGIMFREFKPADKKIFQNFIEGILTPQ